MGIVKHARFLSASLKKETSPNEEKKAPKKEETTELGQAAPRRQPEMQQEVVSAAASGPQLMPHEVVVGDGMQETDVQMLHGDRRELGESNEVSGDGDEFAEDPEVVITPLLKELPHEFRSMMQLAFSKILLKESANAAEELKKGISQYAEVKMGRTVQAMTDKLPVSIRSPYKRAIMMVVKKQARDFAGEGTNFDPAKVLLEATIGLFRSMLPPVVDRMGEKLALTMASDLLSGVVNKVIGDVFGVLQRGFGKKEKAEIVKIVVAGANKLMSKIKKAMYEEKAQGKSPKGDEEQERFASKFALMFEEE